MKSETEQQIVRRLLELCDRGSTDLGPENGSAEVEKYLSPAQLEREQAALFRRRPMPVAHRSRFSAAGDFLTMELAGVPLLLVQGDDGAIAAFINVCRHRGTRVVDEAEGSAKKSFACPYHGWTYGRDGALIGLPHREGFPGERPGLVRLPAIERAGLIFVSLSPDGTALDPELEPILADLESWDLGNHHPYAPRRIERTMNWKLMVEGALEAYHLKTTHRSSIYDMFLDNVLLVDPIGDHLRVVAAKRSLAGLASKPPSTWRLRDHANVIYLLFPNTMLLAEPDHFSVLHVEPQGTDRCRIDAYTLIPARADSIRARAHWDINDQILHDALEEDFSKGESIQRGLASGANQALSFGLFEHGLTYFHRALDRALKTKID